MYFYFYLNGRRPATNELIWISDSEKPKFISGEKLSIKRLYELFRGSRSYGVVTVQFLATLNLFLAGENNISKNTLTEIYRNLSLQALSKKDGNVDLNFDAITELVTKINIRLRNSIFLNRHNAQKSKCEKKNKMKNSTFSKMI